VLTRMMWTGVLQKTRDFVAVTWLTADLTLTLVLRLLLFLLLQVALWLMQLVRVRPPQRAGVESWPERS